MKRSNVMLDDIADWNTLCVAAHLAARGKRDRHQVRCFFASFDQQIARLAHEIRENTIRIGQTTRFQIFDPKPRTIDAPVFRERVLHHALMYHVGPVLDRALIDDTFACRVGKGALAAVKRAQFHARRFRWYAKIDVRQYFPSIDHSTLLRMLEHKFKDEPLLRLIRKVVESHEVSPGKGLPIGALTSQQFANYYLNALDRYLLETLGVLGLVRYMDDTVFWCDSQSDVRRTLAASREFLRDRLHLDLHDRVQINQSTAGVTVCGYRVFPGAIRLTKRRRRLFAVGRIRWEKRYANGEITAERLQAGYAAVLGIVLHADAAAWRREQLARAPALEACNEA